MTVLEKKADAKRVRPMAASNATPALKRNRQKTLFSVILDSRTRERSCTPLVCAPLDVGRIQ
jgi:hypothetical protein